MLKRMLHTAISAITISAIARTVGSRFPTVSVIPATTAVMPTNRSVKRLDNADSIYKTENGKFRAVVQEIMKMHKVGRPVLVGTISIQKSEHLSTLLKATFLPFFYRL